MHVIGRFRLVSAPIFANIDYFTMTAMYHRKAYAYFAPSPVEDVKRMI